MFPEGANPLAIIKSHRNPVSESFILKSLTVDIPNWKPNTSHCINEDISNLKLIPEPCHYYIIGKDRPLTQTYLINKGVWHDRSLPIGPIGVILNGPCPLFCLLEEW